MFHSYSDSPKYVSVICSRIQASHLSLPSPPDQIIPVFAEIADITSDLPELPFPVANLALQVGGMTTIGIPSSRMATLITPPSSPMECAWEWRDAYE